MPEKKSLRARHLATRIGLSDAFCEEAARRAAGHLLPLLQMPVVVAGYSAIRRELSVEPIMEALAATGMPLCLPVTVSSGEPLIFRAWQPDSPLEKDYYAINVPLESQMPCEPDILLVPLLAFDDRGHRLGYGKGYYDRTIAALRAKKPVSVIGMAYSMQHEPALPAGPHDERLDMVVTEERVRYFS